MFGFVFHPSRKGRFHGSERTKLQISIAFKRIPIEQELSEIEERAKEMQDHPAFARSKRFLPKQTVESSTGLK